MTNNLRYYKAYVEKLIALDPTSITIKRTTETGNGYGGVTKTTTTLAAQSVAFYTPKGRRTFLAEKGNILADVVNNYEKILAKADANIQEKDEFEKGGTRYRVTFVRDYLGICKQCEIEAIV